jgi:NADH dehydrogenase
MPVNIPLSSKPRVLIIGAGFAGLELAKGLAGLEAQVVLIDKNNYHTFQPLLYQVATAGLEPESIAYPLREIFRRRKDFIFRMAEVQRIDPAGRCVITSIGEIAYDHLVIATGARTNFFGMKDIEAQALSMKTLPEAVELRNVILESFERALLTTSIEERDRLMSFVVIGGGPTGVELSGAFGELKKVILPYDHPELDFNMMKIHLVDMESRLLKGMSPQASASAEKYLRAHDVNVWLNARVLSYDGREVRLSNNKVIPSFNLIWAAGVTGSVIPGLDEQAVRNGRIVTDVYNRVCGHENIFALGDVAALITDKTPRGFPMLAPVAIAQAKCLCHNLRGMLSGRKELKPFVYHDLGVMATVGRHEAVADLCFGKFQGLVAWFLWAVLHLVALVGFRNRVIALVNWTWSYFRYDRGLRLIMHAKRPGRPV